MKSINVYIRIKIKISASNLVRIFQCKTLLCKCRTYHKDFGPGTGTWNWVYQLGCQNDTYIYNGRYVFIYDENA